MKSLYVSLAGSLLASALAVSSASARVYVNSICQMQENSKDIEGSKTTEKFPLASISKVVTTLWAVEKLGPDYRFATKLHIKNVGGGKFDIHIEGSRDPIFGRNSSYFLISELNRRNISISQIGNLTFDENFLMDWLAEEKPRIGGDTPYYRTIEQQTDAIMRSLRADFASAVRQDMYDSLKSRASGKGIKMVNAPKISVGNIEFLAKQNFSKSADMETLVYKSAPLRTILKRMNNQSNNYVADHLYWNLGGTKAFNEFIKNSLSLDNNDIEFYLGSGNNANYIYDPNRNIYNEASCEAMIKVLFKLNSLLENKGYKLSSVMAVAGEDSTSTVAGYGGNFSGSMIAKTGSVNKAKTLTGTLSTKKGTIYFAVLMNTDGRAEWGQASGVIKNKVNEMIIKNGGPKQIQYSETLPLPFDSGSVLTSDVNVDSKG